MNRKIPLSCLVGLAGWMLIGSCSDEQEVVESYAKGLPTTTVTATASMPQDGTTTRLDLKEPTEENDKTLSVTWRKDAEEDKAETFSVFEGMTDKTPQSFILEQVDEEDE